MKNGDLFIDDRVEIPEDIKNMSKEELEKEIADFETMMRKRKLEKQKKIVIV